MPLRTSKAERTEYEYWIDHQNDGEFLQYLRDNGVDVKRTLDVLKQEKNFSVYFDFVQRQRRLPKDPRGNGTAFKKMRRMSELDAEEKQESFLARWQYNVLNGKIKCLPVWIYRAVLYWVAFYNRRDNR
jgi:hypothetical protein